mgnify:CR=1 FL=1
MATKITWDDADFTWNENTYTWDDVSLILELAGGGITTKIDELEPEKRKRLIHLIMRRKGIMMYDKSKVVNTDIKINVKDVEMLIKEVKAQLELENIHV